MKHSQNANESKLVVITAAGRAAFARAETAHMAQVEAWLSDAFDNTRLSALDALLWGTLTYIEKKKWEGK